VNAYVIDVNTWLPSEEGAHSPSWSNGLMKLILVIIVIIIIIIILVIIRLTPCLLVADPQARLHAPVQGLPAG
jgi:hypothetical protein